jgi:hypothetical protein
VACLDLGGLGSAATAVDPFARVLGEDDYEAARARLREEIARSGRQTCTVLSAYGKHRIETVREHAVRALSDFGCETIAEYAPYMDDTHPWVVRELLRAFEVRRISGAVPFLIRLLDDRRRLISPEGSWTMGEVAHRVLRAVSCQSFHFDSGGSAAARGEAVRQWRDWYDTHRDEPRALWERSGIARALDLIGRDYAPHRREGLELLTLIGGPALPALANAMSRAPEDLSARLTCTPEAPPATFEIVPCLLEVRNISGRRVVLAPGEPEVRVRPASGVPPPGDDAREEAGDHARAGDRARSGVAGSLFPPSILTRLIDLAPGEVLRRPVRIGPVERAGQYRITVGLADAAARLLQEEGLSLPAPSPIEAETIVRFYSR